ncbi:MAG: o-succinylbenzoate synthase [Candidatus Amulumruptor caecigallinarius]|nr:o-succinylbenzoate synthase [Candidatus Amulumruptor caecigallinarius]
MKLQFAPYILRFNEPGGTSRGVMTEKITCILRMFEESSPERYAIGEAGIFPGLSPEADNRFFYKLMELQANIRLGLPTDLTCFPSLQCGMDQLIRDFTGGCKGLYFESPFIHGLNSIEINGLVWMGEFDKMIDRIEQKIESGFKCIKLKIGAIDWRREVEMIEYIRKNYTPEQIQIRVDANGAFNMDTAIPRLKRLADLGVHSIEQPLKAGNSELMRFLCKISPLPIALDEELIGKFTIKDKENMLANIKPAYIVLKPSLCGGISGAEEWIALADKMGIGWWVTSALESNIGLNAIAQWVSTLDVSIHQGLGTGCVFSNNFTSPLELKGCRLLYNPAKSLSKPELDKLDWRE